MTPEPIYSLRKLEELTGRDYWFWDRECTAGRLDYFRTTEGGKRYVPQHAYSAWLEGQMQAAQHRESVKDENAGRAVAAASGRANAAWADFEV